MKVFKKSLLIYRLQIEKIYGNIFVLSLTPNSFDQRRSYNNYELFLRKSEKNAH